MRKLFAAAVLLLTVGCSTMKSDSGLGRATVDLDDPDIEIKQLSTVPFAARHVAGSIPVHYEVSVGNRSKEPITIKQISVVSMGYGAYIVEQTSRPFSKLIQPDTGGSVDFWVPARVDDPSVVGANGPVTLRQFQHIVTQQVNGMPGRDDRN
jgi:hypothetical protein